MSGAITLAKVDSVRRVALYPEGYPERTFVINGVLVTCSSVQGGVRPVSVIIREQLSVVVLLEQNWRSNFRTRCRSETT